MELEKEEAIEKGLATLGSPSSRLIKEGNELAVKIAEENDVDKLTDLTNLFTMNQKKKELARVNRLSNLLELVDDEIVNRFTAYPDSFDNDQLLNYMRATSAAITNTTQSINQTPMIQINNTEVNVNNGSGLDRESRAKVLDAVNNILNSLHANTSDDIIDIEIERKID